MYLGGESDKHKRRKQPTLTPEIAAAMIDQSINLHTTTGAPQRRKPWIPKKKNEQPNNSGGGGLLRE